MTATLQTSATEATEATEHEDLFLTIEPNYEAIIKKAYEIDDFAFQALCHIYLFPNPEELEKIKPNAQQEIRDIEQFLENNADFREAPNFAEKVKVIRKYQHSSKIASETGATLSNIIAGCYSYVRRLQEEKNPE
ncbi:MAG: hypothetical protein O3B09_04115, partial [Proteobacteria bacterium]|nr:hypothetical protein [Pseudomonadota bacterium]